MLSPVRFASISGEATCCHFKPSKDHPMHSPPSLLPALSLSRICFIFAIGIFACTLAGCGNANRLKIVGNWGITQADEVMDRIEASETTSDESQESRMLLTFHRNGRLETKTKMGSVDQKKQGAWKMVSFDPAKNSMVISCEINTQTSEHTITFVDENTIELVPPNMAGVTMKLKFKRQ